MDFDPSADEIAYRDHVKRTIKERIAPRYPEWRENNTTPREMFEVFGSEHLLGFTEEGGMIKHVPWLQNIHLYRELAEFSGGLGIATFVQANLGNEAFYLFGSDGQKRSYLSHGIVGKRLFAFANTEPTAGSDASMIKTKAEDRGDHYLVNGTKTFITNADFADDIIFTAVTDPNAEKPHKGITMLISPGDAPGMTRTRLNKHGWKGSHLCTLQFKDVKVPKANVLGKVGRGFYQTMELFNNGRIGVASLAFGAALGSYRRAYDHAGKRKAFGVTLIEHQSKRNEFADNMGRLQAGWLLIQKAAFTADAGRDFKHYSSLAKLFVTEEGLRISLWGVITLGARGVIAENRISDYPSDSVVALIGEGAPEVQKKIIGENIASLLDML
jgi:alkylation response protein AidB-like acyl-CoA dehydrogenase